MMSMPRSNNILPAGVARMMSMPRSNNVLTTGVARMMSMPRPNNGDVHWIVGSTPILRLLPNVFKVQWLDK